VDASLHALALAVSNQRLDAVEVLLVYRDYHLVHDMVVKNFRKALEPHDRIFALQSGWRPRAGIGGMNEADQAQAQRFSALHQLAKLQSLSSSAHNQDIVKPAQHAAQRCLAVEEKQAPSNQQQ